MYMHSMVVYVHVQGDIVLNGHNGNADFPQAFHKGGTGGIVKVMPHTITIALSFKLSVQATSLLPYKEVQIDYHPQPPELCAHYWEIESHIEQQLQRDKPPHRPHHHGLVHLIVRSSLWPVRHSQVSCKAS